MNDDIKPKPRGKRWKRILKWTSGAILVALIAWTFITYWTSTNDCERYAAAPILSFRRSKSLLLPTINFW